MVTLIKELNVPPRMKGWIEWNFQFADDNMEDIREWLEKLSNEKKTSSKELLESETDLAWAKYPDICFWVDFALCGQMRGESAIRKLPLSELPKIVNEAIAMFGEELEQEIKNSRGSVDYTDKHKAFLSWLETYPVL